MRFSPLSLESTYSWFFLHIFQREYCSFSILQWYGLSTADVFTVSTIGWLIFLAQPKETIADCFVMPWSMGTKFFLYHLLIWVCLPIFPSDPFLLIYYFFNLGIWLLPCLGPSGFCIHFLIIIFSLSIHNYTHTHTHIVFYIHRSHIWAPEHNSSYQEMYIITIKLYWEYKEPWLTHTIHPNHSSLLTSPLDGIQCPHRADECKFLLIS